MLTIHLHLVLGLKTSATIPLLSSCCEQGLDYFMCTYIYILRGVSKTFGEWYQKTNKTEDTNKLTSLAFKIIAILHNTLLATFIKLLGTVSKGLFRNQSQNQSHVLGLPPCLQNVRLSRCSSGGETERSPQAPD